MIFAGLYFMSLGFATPPNIFMFFLGLVLFVPGLIITLLFAGRIDLGSIKASSEKKTPKKKVKPAKRAPVKRQPTFKAPEAVEGVSEKKVVGVGRSTLKAPEAVEGAPKRRVPSVLKEKPEKESEGSEKSIPETSAGAKPVMPKTPTKESRDIKPSTGGSSASESIASEPSRIAPVRKITPEKTIRPAPKKKSPAEGISKSRTTESSRKRLFSLPKLRKGKEDVSEKGKGLPPKKKTQKPVKPAPVRRTPSKTDNSYVTERLKKLKQEYIENVDDVEDLLEDRLDSFKGAINRIRAETREPSIIWSFDASDVQDAMRETITAAEESVVLMYPWIRNIDVSVLKKFMDTESRLIIQEASLDDEASVELIKVLMDNNVEIRTMPHIHTVAAVADDKNGLIISTDPIYESFEVGVIYKDKKSISEIKKLFEEAWNLSDEINLEGV
ncbi:hypothetical protein [Methanothermobacter sp. K4]|uniref:hypothetical protein n=1 Tax=Methanothermobacter sp. K4 TaxID=2913262 RepID=UPI001EDBC64D|nr:hypothetical protein [Methanothermobacter sp. K4]MCG2828929.1 hypothetical protein [Methanothermobacter sp. K4]